jgi:hypothetical protein
MRCSLCHKVFAGMTAFDMHRVGEAPIDCPVGQAYKYRRCLTAEEMLAIGLKRSKGRWCRTLAAMRELEEVA